MNLRCELWDGGEQFGTGTIHAFIGEGVDSVAVIELDGSGFLARATLSCCKIIKPDTAPAKPAQDLAAAIKGLKGEPPVYGNANRMIAYMDGYEDARRAAAALVAAHLKGGE